ncbi:YtxH domain-containing protein [Hydromonas duriensis]|uniref:Uncharacterized protein n=1 Tax=Hydromonas duriensis TaxID=1527608 RepID=A0A4R6Y9B2_9BURK|nr:YtxH domain-containing protein [Hydromonas duriensis]TDR32039.1 hypothetical protein DFR44_106105 [Hydromonas duriensis]
MKIYWTANQIPELTGLDRATQKDLMRRTVQEGRKRLPKNFVMVRVLALLAIALILFAIFGQILKGFLGGAIVGGLIGLAFAALIQTPCIDKGREWLREQGHPKN